MDRVLAAPLVRAERASAPMHVAELLARLLEAGLGEREQAPIQRADLVDQGLVTDLEIGGRVLAKLRGELLALGAQAIKAIEIVGAQGLGLGKQDVAEACQQRREG